VKSLGFILSYLATPQAKRNARILAALLAVLVVIVAIYSSLFHVIMESEGRQYSWPSAVYWTMVTMSTLGFGDIVFESDLGRIFSVVVLLSGSAFILVLLPFTFIQFVFMPWMDARHQARAPRRLPEDTRGHVLLTGVGPVEDALIHRLDQAGIPYAALVADLDEALRLHDHGYRVILGELDDPGTFRAARVDQAALVLASQNDRANTNIAFTVRELSESVTVVATASSGASVDILRLAGCNQVLELGELLGTAIARRVLAPDGRTRVIGEFGELLIAEAITPKALAGRTLQESGLRGRVGISVAGVWERGQFSIARPNTELSPTGILVIAGSREQLDRYDEAFGVDLPEGSDPVVIVGGGRVGRAAGRWMESAGTPYTIIEQLAERIRDPATYVLGDAAELAVLERAGIRRARAVVITTHDDDVNVYLTIYCRRLRPDLQIIARARLDRNVSTLHRAGADAVLSYASTGANAVWNVLTADNTLQLAEGLDVFRVRVPAELAGRTLQDCRIRQATGCTVLAVIDQGRFESNPSAEARLPEAGELVLIGDSQSEDRFLSRYRAT
jgi:Trk K+ transport system NAD-binding subunit